MAFTRVQCEPIRPGATSLLMDISAGGGTVDSIVEGNAIVVDASDPANPIVGLPENVFIFDTFIGLQVGPSDFPDINRIMQFSGTTASEFSNHTMLSFYGNPSWDFFRKVLDITEWTGSPTFTPANPGAGFARFFARVNAGGKGELCVRFPTGAVQVMATEP